jgi:hypothetical protein
LGDGFDGIFGGDVFFHGADYSTKKISSAKTEPTNYKILLS